MKIICISDTHGLHRHLSLPQGDMLIHTGDISNQGKRYEIREFLSWFADQPYTHKIFIGGNHDFFLEQSPKAFQSMIPEGCTYLENSEVIIEGLHIWGSPITPYYYDWAFNRHRGKDIGRYWDKIPERIDILITHGPSAMSLDKTYNGKSAGCEILRERILDVRPRYHLFGHIHEAYGRKKLGYTQCINSSILNIFNKPVNTPQIFEVHATVSSIRKTRQSVDIPGLYDPYYQNRTQ